MMTTQLPEDGLGLTYGGCNWEQAPGFGSAAMWDKPPAVLLCRATAGSCLIPGQKL